MLGMCCMFHSILLYVKENGVLTLILKVAMAFFTLKGTSSEGVVFTMK